MKKYYNGKLYNVFETGKIYQNNNNLKFYMFTLVLDCEYEVVYLTEVLSGLSLIELQFEFFKAKDQSPTKIYFSSSLHSLSNLRELNSIL